MDKRQLKAFICVFEERNITRAAQLLNLTQPALSATIKLLEEELATTLFIRRPRGVEVTEDARVLYPQARKMLSDMQALVTRFRQPSDLSRETGCVESVNDAVALFRFSSAQRPIPVQGALDDGNAYGKSEVRCALTI